MRERQHQSRLIVDSGAFTAWNTGRTILLDDYCRFLDSIEDLRPFYAVQLDVFGQPDQTYKNFLIMKERGYDVMPVFTRGDTLERLEEFYSKTDYIMFGGIVTGGKNREYVKWFLSQNKGRKCHWLGFVDMPFIKAKKPESVDSSSWASAARYGTLKLYKGYGQFRSCHRSDFAKPPTKEIRELLTLHGVSQKEMALMSQEKNWRGLNSMSQQVNARAAILHSVEVEKHIGTKVYLAMGAGNAWAKYAFAEYDKLKTMRLIE